MLTDSFDEHQSGFGAEIRALQTRKTQDHVANKREVGCKRLLSAVCYKADTWPLDIRPSIALHKPAPHVRFIHSFPFGRLQ